MAYHTTLYLILFLPSAAAVYQITARPYRWYILLAFSLYFYICFGEGLLRYAAAAVVATWISGLLIELQAGGKKAQKLWLLLGLGSLLGTLLTLKYSNFFAVNGNRLWGLLFSETPFSVKQIILPLGISFYTLSVAGYLIDVYFGKLQAERNPGKLFLFLTWFPMVMEGPICRYGELEPELFAGKGISWESLCFGIQRIVWGLFKKMVIADRLNVVVKEVYEGYTAYDGAVIAFAALAYTVQLYMEFSGCMDMVIGSSGIFGIRLPENFSRPFFSKNISEFWRRWHISLGGWFKEYVFYPVSLLRSIRSISKRIRKRNKHWGETAAAAMGLFPVWLCNGLWHGPRWSFIFMECITLL